MDEYFAFVYKGKRVKMVLNGSEFADPDTRKWKITKIFIPEDLNQEEILSEFCKALLVYGYFGDPNDKEERAVTDF